MFIYVLADLRNLASRLINMSFYPQARHLIATNNLSIRVELDTAPNGKVPLHFKTFDYGNHENTNFI